MASEDLALFRAFPRLRERLPRYAILDAPTPVAPLPLPGFAAGSLFVKRDERCSPLYGGNKPRKLEFLLGRALRRRARRLVTSGGLGTHHGLATAILGRAAGLETTLVLIDQPLTPGVRESLMLGAAWGADLVWARGVPAVAVHTLHALASSQLRGERPQLILPGGTSPVGMLGCVSAGLELGEQVRSGQLPEPAEVFVAVGTGGTLAGLVVGLGLAGLSTRVCGVLVTDILPPSRWRLTRMIRATTGLLCRNDPRVPGTAAASFSLIHGHVGGGYGSPTPEAEDAVALAREHGIRLETTYTGKCLAALRARGPGPGPILFWNTFSDVDVAAAAPSPPTLDALPRDLRQLVSSLDSHLAAR